MSFGDLPYAKSAACKCPENEENKTPEERHNPDRRLVNWETWMRNRGDMNQKLVTTTGRNEDKLLMNSFEDKRPDIEQKVMLEYAKYPHRHDRYRGNPAFWKLPSRLAQFCGEPQHYEAVIPKMELCKMPDIQYVKVPDYIKKEKKAEYKEEQFFWRNSDYLNVRYKDPELKIIEPFKPDLQNLIVIGKHVPADIAKIPSIKAITCSSPQKSPPKKEESCILIMNDSCVLSDAFGEHVMTIYINSSSFTKIATAHLQIKNRSNWCLRFNFIPHVTERIFETPRDSNTVQKLFFNKNQQLLQPGETQNFPFWYRSKRPGPYSESLEMRVRPDVWKGRLKIVLTIRAHTGPKNFLDRSYELLTILEERARARIIQETFDDIMKKLPKKQSDIVVYSYDKASIFEAANSVYDPIHLRPRYLYDKRIVDELESFFERIRLAEHPQCWDYKLDNLRVIVKDRENYNEAQSLEEDIKTMAGKLEECKTKHEQFEQSVNALWAASDKKGGKDKKPTKPPKPAAEKKGKEGKEKEKVQTVMKEPERPPLPHTLSDELEDIIKKLKSPSSFLLEHTKRLRLCYNLFCAYIDNIFEKVETLEKSLNILRLLPKERKRNIAGTERIYDEVMDSSHMERKKFKEIPPMVEETKAPEWTHTIPLVEHVTRYRAFHGIDDKGSKGKGKGGKPANTKSKSTKSGKKTSETTSNTVTLYEAIQEVVDEESPRDDKVWIPEKDAELYATNIYLIVYTNLQMFVDDLVAIFEMESRPVLPQCVLDRMVKSQDHTLAPIPSLQVRVYDLKKVISQTLCSNVDVECALKLVPQEKFNLIEKSRSVWSLLNPYLGTKQIVTQPSEGEVYGLLTKTHPPEVCEEGTSMTPPEIILERNLQTSICGSDSVAFSSVELEDVIYNCDCHEEKKTDIEMNLPYHDSVGGFDKEIIISSSEKSSCKE